MSTIRYTKSMDSKSKSKLLYKILCNTLGDRDKLFEYIDIKYQFNDENQESVNIDRLLNRESVIYCLFNDNHMFGISSKYFNENIISVEEYIKIINMSNNERNIKLSLDKAKEIYLNASEEMKILLENTFPELKDSQFPKSWEELCKIKTYEKGFCTNVCGKIHETEFRNGSDYETTVSTRERAEKILLLQQLLEIKDYWNEIDNFIPKTDGQSRQYVIYLFDNELTTTSIIHEKYMFAFKTQKRAEKFMYTFEKELLQVLSI